MQTEANSTDNYNVALAFTEWLDKHNKSYFIVVKDLEGNGENLCAVNGDADDLVVTLTSGMLRHKDIEKLLSNAFMLAAANRYAKEHKDGDDV